MAALYEQGRVHHVGTFSTLEDQLCLWDATSGDLSPDRLDAVVWAVTELAVDAVPLRLVQTDQPATDRSAWWRNNVGRHFDSAPASAPRSAGTIDNRASIGSGGLPPSDTID